MGVVVMDDVRLAIRTLPVEGLVVSGDFFTTLGVAAPQSPSASVRPQDRRRCWPAA
jgi:hypothetical protein